MGEKPSSKHPRPLLLVPVPVEKRSRRQPPVQQVHWLTLCIKWLQYQSIQLRWDIERGLARILHRRWGT